MSYTFLSRIHRCTSLVILPSSMKTIPFTVPTGGSGPRKGDQRLVEEGSTGSGSEPSTPSTIPTTRGSMDSLSSAGGDSTFRGKSFSFTIGGIQRYCDVPGSPCYSKKQIKCTVRFFFKFFIGSYG